MQLDKYDAPARVVLVTGGSRGVGARVAQLLASADTHVIVGYHERAERAESVAQSVRDAGGHASTLRADISDGADCAAMIGTIKARFGRLDALILTASVGGGLGGQPNSAMRLNREAQRRLALAAVPLMPAGARIVFATSHQAHFFPYKAVPKGHTSFAAGMQAGEATLHAMRPEFHRAGVHFTVVSGELGDESFAQAIANAATNPQASGIVYVGGPDPRMSA